VPAVRVFAQNRLETRAVDVVTAEQALADTRRAFDGVASTYDRSNEHNPILRAMRHRARTALERSVLPGARILDLGSGPGTDLVGLARAGYDVTGVDWSPGMVAEARRRIDEAGVSSRARVEHLGIHQLPQLAPTLFDAAYSNFGPLNCVSDLALAANDVAARLRPRGVLVATIIGRVCPWEIALYITRGSWSRAMLRFSRDAVAVPLEGRTVWTRYYTPGEFTSVFTGAGFAPVLLKALGCAAPPPYLEAFAERHPRLVASLHGLDDLIGSWPGVRTCGDHFLIVMRRS
jgi:ubiquinone/menaquinone biosynthesis C-methylase UbiE